MSEQDIVGSAAGGVVTITLSESADTPAGFTCSAVHVDPAAIDPEDPSLIEDLISAAINDALSQAEAEDTGTGGLAGMLGGLSGLGADLPGMLASSLSGLGANLPDLLAGAMEAFGLSGSPSSATPTPPAATPPTADAPAATPPTADAPAATPPTADAPAATPPPAAPAATPLPAASPSSAAEATPRLDDLDPPATAAPPG